MEVEHDLSAFHVEHPIQEGADLSFVRRAAAEAIERSGAPTDPGLVDSLLDHMVAEGRIVREGSILRTASHRVTLGDRESEFDDLLRAVAAAEPTPPTVAELLSSGVDRDVIEAATRGGALVRVSPDLVMTPGFVAKAELIIRSASEGITVGAFREALGTSRRYALPLLEYLDRVGISRREGDLRVPRSTRT